MYSVRWNVDSSLINSSRTNVFYRLKNLDIKKNYDFLGDERKWELDFIGNYFAECLTTKTKDSKLRYLVRQGVIKQ